MSMIHKMLTISILIITTMIISSKLLFADGSNSQYTQQQIDKYLEQQWNSLSTISLTCQEYPINENQERVSGSTYFAYDYLLGASQQRRVRAVLHGAGKAPEVISETRDDGSDSHTLLYDPKDYTKLLRVHTKTQTDSRTQFYGTKFSALWLMFPDGQPLLDLYRKSTSILETKGLAEGLVVFVNTENDKSIECELDPSHDWLAKRLKLSIAGKSIFYRVSEFGLTDGRYYPKKGIFNMFNKPEKIRGFEVVACSFNRPIPQTEFERPFLKTGVTYNVKDGRVIMKRDVHPGTKSNQGETRGEETVTRDWPQPIDHRTPMQKLTDFIFLQKWAIIGIIVVAVATTIVVARGRLITR